MSYNSTNIINPKPCNYNCGTRIYWDTVSNSYLEVFNKKKHVCPNRVNKSNTTNNNTNTSRSYYYKKSYQKEAKIPSSNSIELITGPIETVQRKYEILSDIVTSVNGKVHGSQSHINGNIVSLIVYYEVPSGMRDEVKQRYKNRI
ncbi:MAG TPA: hypothetical protein VFV86_08750 [Nitrososphaeraceae archaeon]|nr:hypothetical protein [Nitrososphaeraceae archaeon]